MESIQQWSDFQLTMTHGRQIKTAHFVLHQWQPAVDSPHESVPVPSLCGREGDARLGVLIPKRWAKKAVTRNLIRRQVKSALCSTQTNLPDALYVVRLRSSFSKHEFISAASQALKNKVFAELQQLMQQLKTLG